MRQQDRPKPTLAELQDRVVDFSRQRKWRRFNNPKNLSMALSVESNELMEMFTWLSAAESTAALRTKKVKKQVENELSDVLFLLLTFCAEHDIDIHKAFNRKLTMNAKKYPEKQQK